MSKANQRYTTTVAIAAARETGPGTGLIDATEVETIACRLQGLAGLIRHLRDTVKAAPDLDNIGDIFAVLRNAVAREADALDALVGNKPMALDLLLKDA